jgi:hypothetical protein
VQNYICSYRAIFCLFSTLLLFLFQFQFRNLDFLSGFYGVFRWILDAKQEKTRIQRILSVANASEKSDLIGYWKKVKDKREIPKISEGPTPIESAKNIGPKRGMDLRTLGIETLEQLQEEGWEEIAIKALELYPEICNPGFFKALAGAATEQKATALDAGTRATIKSLSSEANKYRSRRF